MPPAKSSTKKMTEKEQQELEKALNSDDDSSTEQDEWSRVEELGSIGGIKVEPVESASKFLNLLVYGESGVGKTVFAGSASLVESMSPVLLLNIEGGTLSLKDFYPNVHTVPIRKFSQLQDIYNDLYKGKSKYKTAIIDSHTEAQKLAMRDHMRYASGRDSSLDEDVPQMQHWLKNIEQMRKFTRAWRDLPINTIFTALESQEKDNRGRIQTKPSMNGKLQSELPGFFDLVLYMYTKTEKRAGTTSTRRMVLTRRTDTIQAKDRSNKLPLAIENPTMETIYGVMNGTIDAASLTIGDSE